MKTQKQNHFATEAEAELAEAPIHGDILQAIFSHVPLIDLVPASHVSTAWNRAVFSSLRHFNKIKPWLIVHTQRARSPHVTTTHAYDPRSNLWIKINQPSIDYVAALRSSHSTLLYMLAPSKLLFSLDPLNLTWHHVDAPPVWRKDPIVAMVGHYVIIAGGACNFEDSPLAVDMYNVETRAWESCENMPAILKDSAASTWLSVAVNSDKFFVAEKFSGLTYSFNPQTKSWYGPYDLRPAGQNILFSVIAFAGNRLILVGLTGFAGNVQSVKVWEVKGEWLEECKEIGEMPQPLVGKLKGSCCLASIEATAMEDVVYIHNPSNPEELVRLEMDEGNCEWGSIKNVVVNDGSRIMDRFVFSCSSVGMGDLCRALMHKNRRFSVKEIDH
ncbi:F-box/kelch-repeat protein At1g23390 [Pistacia vera]|uniref:F-box/kelch-repeat protein At1g23390 n=1 Tax=Pistacia vera TaxID=55513 RepID=UPI0012631E30|nr:F-box/kelch-repeat protein At1g23390 [Pistacia vera]